MHTICRQADDEEPTGLQTNQAERAPISAAPPGARAIGEARLSAEPPSMDSPGF